MRIDLNEIEWKEFLIGEEFLVKNSKAYHKSKLKEVNQNGLSYVSRTNLNNGVESLIKDEDFVKNDPNSIVFGAENAAFFYQPNEYITGNKMYCIQKKCLNKYSGLFLQMMLNSSIENSGFGYGKGLTGSRVKKRFVMLPVTSDGEPDYALMESYAKQCEQSKLDAYHQYTVQRVQKEKLEEVESLEEKVWSPFEIGEIFKLSQGKSKGLNHLQKSTAGVNYLGATNVNNGVLCQVKRVDKLIHPGNAIAFIRNGEGSMGYSVYKAEEFIATSDISVGYNCNLNRYNGLFITTVADKVRGKYNFGYKRSGKRLKKERIMLPVDSQNQPDFLYMENYIKSLEYKKLKSYYNKKGLEINEPVAMSIAK